MAGSRVIRSSLKVTIISPPCLTSARAGVRAGTAAIISAASDTDAGRRFMRKSPHQSGLLLSKLDPRIDQRRNQVREQVAEDDCAGGQQGYSHDDRNVDLLDGLPGQLSDTGPAEDGFDHHDAAHEVAEVDPNHCDDW